MMPRPSRSVRIKSSIVERRLAEEFRAALVFQHQQLTLHRTDGRRRHVAVFLADLLGVLGEIGQQLAQVLEIDQPLILGIGRAEFVVGEAERDIDDAFLHVVEIEHARQQQRSHLEHGGADRMALLAEQVPEHHGKLVGLVFDADIGRPLDQEILRLAGRGDAGQIALDIGGEHRHAGARKSFRHHLQRHGLAGAGRAGHQAVPVGELERKIFRLLALADEDFVALHYVCHHLRLCFLNGAAAGLETIL